MTLRPLLTTALLTLALSAPLAAAAPKKKPTPVEPDRALVAGLCNAYGVHAAETVKSRNEGMPLANAVAVTAGFGHMLDLPDIMQAELQEITRYVYANPAVTASAARDGALLACTRTWLLLVSPERMR